MDHRVGRALLRGAVVLASITLSRADALDLGFLISREHRSTFNIIATVLFLMMANYLVNLVFVGFPVTWYAGLPLRRLLGGILLLTIVGQGVDWLGRTMATLVAHATPQLFGGVGPEAFERTLIASNLLISGVWVGLSVYTLTRRWWSVPTRQAVIISLIAAIISNPGWAVGVWLQAGLVSPDVA